MCDYMHCDNCFYNVKAIKRENVKFNKQLNLNLILVINSIRCGDLDDVLLHFPTEWITCITTYEMNVYLAAYMYGLPIESAY